METGENSSGVRFERIDEITMRFIRRVFTSPRFEKEFNRLPKRIQELARKKDRLFRTDAFYPPLETHKLSGELKHDWAYSVNQQYRVHFYFVNDHEVVYLNIGTHKIYK